MEAQAVRNPAASLAGYGGVTVWSFAPRSSNREWLPAPAVEVNRPEATQGRRQTRSGIPQRARVENKLMGLLLVGASAGVAYGFWMLTQLVENWAGFQAGVTRLVE